jgi:L-ascorbate metabolism protein UlaG (beta-lactamase superfamily)
LRSLAAGLAEAWNGLGRRPDAARRQRMARSPQWRDGRFHNPQPIWSNYAKAIAAGLRSSPHARPAQSVPVARVNPALFQTAPSSGLRITWLGHSTSLIEIDGYRVLTDPVWSNRASPAGWIGIPRWYEPLIALADLPPIDAVLISHDHYDHLDHRTIRALNARPVTFIVPLGVGAHLEYWGVPAYRIIELDWWENVRVGELEVTSTPARHASARGLFDKDLTLWSGYALRGTQHRVYFSGDTGMQDAFSEIGARLGPFDATLIETGEYNAAWPDWHIGPEQAIDAHRLVRGNVMIPIHWGLFSLAPHTWTEPVERAVAAAARAGVTLATPRPGESVEPTQETATGRWWPELPWSPADQTPIVSSRDGKKPGASVPFSPLALTPAPSSNRWLQLQTELRDLAFMLDRGGNPAAADVASMVAARIGELLTEEPGAPRRTEPTTSRLFLP